MSQLPSWRKVESKVHQEGIWLIFVVGAVLFSMGSAGYLAFADAVQPGMDTWIVRAFLGIFILIGGFLLASALKSLCFPHRVRHAADDVLPDVPQEPLIFDGAIVRGRLTHELCENDHGWELKPAERMWRNDLRFLILFGVPFLIFFAVFWAWLLSQFVSLFLAASGGIAVTTLCGGVAFIGIFFLMRSGSRHLCVDHPPRWERHGVRVARDAQYRKSGPGRRASVVLRKQRPMDEIGNSSQSGRGRSTLPLEIQTAARGHLGSARFVGTRIGRGDGPRSGAASADWRFCRCGRAYAETWLCITGSLSLFRRCRRLEGGSDRAKTRPPLRVGVWMT